MSARAESAYRAPIALQLTDMLRAPPEDSRESSVKVGTMQSVPKPNRINSTNVNGSQNPSHDASTATSRVRLRSCNQEPTIR